MSGQSKSRRRDSAPPLPPVTVERFGQVTTLIERLAQQHTDVFLSAMSTYQRDRLAVTQRGLTHTEAAAVAAQLAEQHGRDDPAALAAEVQASGLQATDPIEPRELLLAAGVRTAPAFLDAALRVCALIEMPADIFESAVEYDTLDRALDAAVDELRKLPMTEARPRAAAALAHFTSEVGGASPGEAWSLLTGTVWQALTQALAQVAGSASLSSTRLVEPTAGPDATSSTG